MKKPEEMRAEYRRDELGKGVRGKRFAEFEKGSNLVLLTPELSKVFPTTEAVNAALSSLVSVARSVTDVTRRSTRTRTAKPPAPANQDSGVMVGDHAPARRLFLVSRIAASERIEALRMIPVLPNAPEIPDLAKFLLLGEAHRQKPGWTRCPGRRKTKNP